MKDSNRIGRLEQLLGMTNAGEELLPADDAWLAEFIDHLEAGGAATAAHEAEFARICSRTNAAIAADDRTSHVLLGPAGAHGLDPQFIAECGCGLCQRYRAGQVCQCRPCVRALQQPQATAQPRPAAYAEIPAV